MVEVHTFSNGDVDPEICHPRAFHQAHGDDDVAGGGDLALERPVRTVRSQA